MRDKFVSRSNHRFKVGVFLLMCALLLLTIIGIGGLTLHNVFGASWHTGVSGLWPVLRELATWARELKLRSIGLWGCVAVVATAGWGCLTLLHYCLDNKSFKKTLLLPYDPKKPIKIFPKTGLHRLQWLFNPLAWCVSIVECFRWLLSAIVEKISGGSTKPKLWIGRCFALILLPLRGLAHLVNLPWRLLCKSCDNASQSDCAVTAFQDTPPSTPDTSGDEDGWRPSIISSTYSPPPAQYNPMQDVELIYHLQEVLPAEPHAYDRNSPGNHPALTAGKGFPKSMTQSKLCPADGNAQEYGFEQLPAKTNIPFTKIKVCIGERRAIYEVDLTHVRHKNGDTVPLRSLHATPQQIGNWMGTCLARFRNAEDKFKAECTGRLTITLLLHRMRTDLDGIQPSTKESQQAEQEWQSLNQKFISLIRDGEGAESIQNLTTHAQQLWQRIDGLALAALRVTNAKELDELRAANEAKNQRLNRLEQGLAELQRQQGTAQTGPSTFFHHQQDGGGPPAPTTYPTLPDSAAIPTLGGTTPKTFLAANGNY